MNIVIVSNVDFPWNRGIDRAVRAFLEGGHNVFVAAENRKNLPRFDQYLDSVKIYRLKGSKNRFLLRIINNHVPFNIFWLFFLFKLAFKTKPDLIVVREIHLIPLVSLIRFLWGIPIFLDMREAYPYAVEVWGKSSLLHYITRNIFLIKLFERISVRLSDHIFVVAQSQVERIIKSYSYKSNRISIVPNTVNKEYHHKASILYEKRIRRIQNNINKSPFVLRLVYIGEILPYRDIGTFIDGLTIAVERGAKVEFTIIGEGEDAYMKKLYQMIEKTSNVIMKKYLPADEVASALAEFDYGVISYELNNHTNNTIPGKLCEYLSLGLPVISTKIKDIVDFNDSFDFGFFVSDSKDSNEVAGIICKIYEGRWDALLRQAQEARRLYDEKMSYKTAISAYLDSLGKIKSSY